MTALRLGSLFDGIGVFPLAAVRCGIEPVWASEIEKAPISIKAHEGDPIAIQAVLDRYAGYIRYFSKMNGYYNSDMEDYIKTKLIESLFKFRLDR